MIPRLTYDGSVFGEKSILKRVAEESVVLLGGGRALLLQLAHPLVSAAVAEHSRFQENPLARLTNTLNLLTDLVRGDSQQAALALRRFQRVHATVHGCLRAAAGCFPAGTVYSADDESLKFWIHATYIDSALLSYERFVMPLTGTQREQYYQDSRQLAQMLGIAPEQVPATLAEFEQYMHTQLRSDRLAVTAEARILAQETVRSPQVWLPARLPAKAVAFVTAGLLPPRFRHEYGFQWNGRDQRLLNQLSRTSQRLLPYCPTWLRRLPQAGEGGFVTWALGNNQ